MKKQIIMNVAAGVFSLALVCGMFHVMSFETRAGGSVSGNGVSGNTVGVSGNGTNSNVGSTEKVTWEAAPTEAEIHAQKVAEKEAKQKKIVTTANGTAVKTEIAGVYEVETLNGSAIKTAKTDVLKAVGISEEEISKGTNASIYMTDYLSKEDKVVLTEAADKSGKTVLTMVVSDMYTITKDGKIDKVKNTTEPIFLVFGVPQREVNANRTYSVLCVQPDGSYVEMEDMDDDPSTITIDTTVFGKYVIVY